MTPRRVSPLLAIALRAAPPTVFPFPHTWDRARYPQAWLCTRPSEATVQTQILALLARLGVRAFPTDAGAKTLRGRAIAVVKGAGGSAAAIAVMNRGRAGAAVAGVCDVIGTLPGGRSLYVEVKRPEWLTWRPDRGGVVTQYQSPGQPTPAQLQFLLDMHTQGALVGVAWSTDDVTQLLAHHSPVRP